MQPKCWWHKWISPHLTEYLWRMFIMPSLHSVGHKGLMAVNVPLFDTCLTLSKERKGAGSWRLAGRKPMIGWPVTPRLFFGASASRGPGTTFLSCASTVTVLEELCKVKLVTFTRTTTNRFFISGQHDCGLPVGSFWSVHPKGKLSLLWPIRLWIFHDLCCFSGKRMSYWQCPTSMSVHI